MKRTLMAAIGFAFLMTLAQPAAAQDLASSIVGVWKIKSQVRKEVASGKSISTYGENPIGHIVFTRGGHLTFVITAANRKPPASANLTDAERIDLFKTASFGTASYKIEGNKLLAHYDTSWHQLWTGTDISSQAEITGKTLTLTTGPFKTPVDGLDVLAITTWERTE